MLDNVSQVEQIIGYEFIDRRLIKSAITHSSSADCEDYQRMEYLGDSIIDFLVAEYLFIHFNSANEGLMSQMRASLVDEETLCLAMEKLELKEHIVHSEAFGKNLPLKMVSDVYESITAAIYLDSNDMNQVRDFVYRTLIPLMDENKKDYLDYKSKLNEYCQKNKKKMEFPYEKTGVDHKPQYSVTLFIDGEKIAEAVGRTKGEAEKAASKIALQKLKLID